jgi:hypothetical protein
LREGGGVEIVNLNVITSWLKVRIIEEEKTYIVTLQQLEQPATSPWQQTLAQQWRKCGKVINRKPKPITATQARFKVVRIPPPYPCES